MDTPVRRCTLTHLSLALNPPHNDAALPIDQSQFETHRNARVNTFRARIRGPSLDLSHQKSRTKATFDETPHGEEMLWTY